MRWLNPHGEYEYRIRTRPFKAPAPEAAPRFVLLEEGKTLQRLFSRYLHGFDTLPVPDLEGAVLELNRSPAQALIVNAPLGSGGPAPLGQLANLPYGTPTVACWVPGEGEAARRLGVVRYLTKPVTRHELLSALEDLGEEVADDAAGGGEADEYIRESGSCARQHPTVLVVDDHPEALQLFARMLSSAERGYRVIRAESGPRALSLLRQQRPDVVLLDLIMPGMDGFQVLQEKGQDPAIRDIPVIVITSKDPSGEPIVSDGLTVTRSGGLSVRDLLGCIQAVSEVLSPLKT
jgi:CheY-like chemotaxis protein